MPLNLEAPISVNYKYQIVRYLDLKFRKNIKYFFIFLKSYNIFELEFSCDCDTHLNSSYIYKDCIRLYEFVSNILYRFFLHLGPNLVATRNPTLLKAKPFLPNTVPTLIIVEWGLEILHNFGQK